VGRGQLPTIGAAFWLLMPTRPELNAFRSYVIATEGELLVLNSGCFP
jgi:hypothetical protein